jgi:hypothetical protein
VQGLELRVYVAWDAVTSTPAEVFRGGDPRAERWRLLVEEIINAADAVIRRQRDAGGNRSEAHRG